MKRWANWIMILVKQDRRQAEESRRMALVFDAEGFDARLRDRGLSHDVLAAAAGRWAGGRARGPEAALVHARSRGAGAEI
jgi:hypothetical protein